jgi:hypothetical protein
MLALLWVLVLLTLFFLVQAIAGQVLGIVFLVPCACFLFATVAAILNELK